MKIVVLHRIPYHKIQYHRGIDHQRHEVVYVGTRSALSTIPDWLPCRRLERPGLGAVAQEVLLSLRDESRVDRVVSLSEYELLDAARVREALGVAGASVSQVELHRDKLKMKAAVASRGLRVPRNLRADLALASEALPGHVGRETTLHGRVVLKPVDGASSEGVSVFDSFAQALSALRRGKVDLGARGADQFELEEFVEGPILHVDGLNVDGRFEVLVGSRYVGTCLGYAQGTPLGSVQYPMTAELSEWTAECLRAVGLEQGSFHLELIETPRGYVFLEVAARVGGADVVDALELTTGVYLPARELSWISGDAVEPTTVGARDEAMQQGPQRYHGWFVFPGHHLPSGSCRIEGAESFESDACVVRWSQLAADRSLPRGITYQSVDVPLAGLIGAESSVAMTAWLERLFTQVRVLPSTPSVVSARSGLSLSALR